MEAVNIQKKGGNPFKKLPVQRSVVLGEWKPSDFNPIYASSPRTATFNMPWAAGKTLTFYWILLGAFPGGNLTRGKGFQSSGFNTGLITAYTPGGTSVTARLPMRHGTSSLYQNSAPCRLIATWEEEE